MSRFSRGPDQPDRPDDHEPFRRPAMTPAAPPAAPPTAPTTAPPTAPTTGPTGPRPTAPPERDEVASGPSGPPPAPPAPIDLDAPYGPPAQQSRGRRPLRLALVVLLCLLSFGGGYLAHAAGLTLSGGDDVAGSPDRPIAVDLGQEFAIDGTLFREGWTAPRDQFEIRRLIAYNDREDEEPVRVSIEFLLAVGDLRTTTVTCVSDGEIGFGESQTLSCDGDGDIPPYLRPQPIDYRVAATD